MKDFIEAARNGKKTKFLRVIMCVSLALFPWFCLFVLDYMNFEGNLHYVLRFFRMFPKQYLFEIALIYIIFAFLLLVCKKAVIAGGILGGLSLACAYTNYMKVAMNGEHFFPTDLAMVPKLGELLGFASESAPWPFWLGVAAVLLWCAAFWLFAVKLPLSIKFRLPPAAAIVVVMAMAFSSPNRADNLLAHFNMSSWDAALQNSNYRANSFLGAFTINTIMLQVQKPEGYSRASVETVLAGYEETPTETNAEDFDVIVVLSESFFDARILDGVEFSKNPLPNYDALRERENCYSGMMYTTAISGGTVRPEFNILSGLTLDYFPNGIIPYTRISKPIDTFVSNYRDEGYDTIAMHPFNLRFYSREGAYGNIGFEKFYGLPELEELTEPEYKHENLSDLAFERAMETYLDGAEKPVFMFAITMQNHQPYDNPDPGEPEITITSDRLDETELLRLSTYTQNLMDADRMLGALAEYIDSRERPTILLFYGDHLPNLGGNHSTYIKGNLFNTADGLNTGDLKAMYSTPFLIYSNRDVEPGLLEPGGGNEISAYHLLNAVAVSTGFHRTPYMNLLAEYHGIQPYWNIRLGIPETAETEKYNRAMQIIAYDRLAGANYSEGK